MKVAILAFSAMVIATTASFPSFPSFLGRKQAAPQYLTSERMPSYNPTLSSHMYNAHEAQVQPLPYSAYEDEIFYQANTNVRAFLKCPEGSTPSEDGSICCVGSCGTCGGYGCDLRPGGSKGCCMGVITASGVVCGEPPCVAESDIEYVTCPEGSVASPDGSVCCKESCSTCGGTGCSKRPGGATNCCMGHVQASGVQCGYPPDKAPPCLAAKKPACPLRSFGSPENYACCPRFCGYCGGPGCMENPAGIRRRNCCQGDIIGAGLKCAVTQSAPCSNV